MKSFLITLLILLLSQSSFAQEEKVFKAGAFASNINPPLGTSIAGSMREGHIRHIHDDLHARCLVLDDGTDRLAIVLVDSCMVLKETMDEAKSLIEKETGIPKENILIAATHSHSAPTSAYVFQSEPDPAYRDFLVRRIADGVQCAVNNLEPAKIGWGSAEEPDQVFNRRWYLKEGAMSPNPFGELDKVKMNPGRASSDLVSPAGPTDPEVSFISVLSADENRHLAILANYSLHYVGGVGGGHASADYFGAFADRIQELVNADRQDPAFVGILSNGTSGDINNIDFTQPSARQESYEQIHIVANDVAEAVDQALDSVDYKDWVDLDSAQKQISLGVRLPSVEEVAEAKEILAEAKDPNDLQGLRDIYAKETVDVSTYPKEVPLILQTLRIGDLGIAAIPCEVFVEIGLEIKDRSPFEDTFTIELANGYNGYLPTPKHHELGGYETWRAKSSYLEPEASPQIVSVLMDLFGEIH
ncbi:MAG: neutral/alkaline non-lysosomal ceramidase N-terminal domain-containing protein [Candidatus Omnitrophica bacterium]|nr:neutral/alkaline non-lysosomal ceramidase N-terminal domain-containing protein [Candidatus Omnitrophota bacterium]